MTDLEILRQRIAENVYSLDRNSLGFDTCGIFWNQDMEEWIIIHTDAQGNRTAGYWDNLERHLQDVPDNEILDWCEEYLEDEHEEEAAE